jgi:ABC-2 type transport system ATP-binding protein
MIAPERLSVRGSVVGRDMTAPTGEPMIVVDALEKHYGATRAVDGISFCVASGEVFGLLGHNGAGKTTTIRMLTGRARPTAGHATIAGHDIVDDLTAIKPLINLVFEDQNLYERLSGRENLHFFCDLYGVPRERASELLDAVGLIDAADRKVKTYSTGMKQRLLIARSLVNQPRLLFLDEPTRGLDPASARDIREIIRRLSASGTTVFLTTHYMEEADELCQRVAFLSQGQIVALDEPRELKLRYGQRRATVLLDDRSEHTLDLDDGNAAEHLETWMREGRVLTIHSHEGTLEDVFIALANRPL